MTFKRILSLPFLSLCLSLSPNRDAPRRECNSGNVVCEWAAGKSPACVVPEAYVKARLIEAVPCEGSIMEAWYACAKYNNKKAECAAAGDVCTWTSWENATSLALPTAPARKLLQDRGVPNTPAPNAAPNAVAPKAKPAAKPAAAAAAADDVNATAADAAPAADALPATADAAAAPAAADATADAAAAPAPAAAKPAAASPPRYVGPDGAVEGGACQLASVQELRAKGDWDSLNTISFQISHMDPLLWGSCSAVAELKSLVPEASRQNCSMAYSREACEVAAPLCAWAPKGADAVAVKPAGGAPAWATEHCVVTCNTTDR